MNKQIINLFLCAGLLCSLLISCGSVKDITYLQGTDFLHLSHVADTFDLKIQKDDLLNIVVNSLDQELAAPFNLQPIVGSGASYMQSQGFLVDAFGYINYPVLGKVKVMGMKRRELIEYLQNRLIKEGYIKDPIVTIRFENFRISILGEVSRPGTYPITTERITLLEAIALAGDLTIHGKRDRVAVMREVDGVRTILYHDLRSLDVLQSPDYFLRQNDLIYVEPNRVRAEASTQNQFTNLGTWISLISFLASMSVLIFK